MSSFSIAESEGGNAEAHFYGPWNRLLNTMFPVDSKFEVHPQYPPPGLNKESVDFVAVLIRINKIPVFMVEVKPPANFHLQSKRTDADEQLRRRLLETSVATKIPVLHGISAFGTKIAFYKFDPDTRYLEPRGVAHDPDFVKDTAPEEWWAFDILEEEGAKKFQDVVENVKETCSPLLS